MERTVVLKLLCGLLLAFTTALPNSDDWDIYSFHINSTVTSRYATTTITSRVVNRMDEAKEIEFHVQIPKNAFISRFRMFVDGQAYDGEVKAKEVAQRQYADAVSRGQSAVIVSSVGRTMEEFKTSVTIAALKKVTFELTYEELLMRQLGKYNLQIHAQPLQPVKDFKVDVYIHEQAGINFVEIKGGLTKDVLADAITMTHSGHEAWVHFYPTVDQQKTCSGCGDKGLNGDLVIVYDVDRENSLGDIETSPGYFVHHFAPVGLPRISKNVVFVIDRSGSMHGRKMEQTRTALIHILGDLAEDDFFGLITFDGEISHWKRELLQATSTNVESAKSFASNIDDGGATNINDALLAGARLLNNHPREGSASILILLTDGDPTAGVTIPEAIQSNVRRAISGKFPLYCLGFGSDVNFDFLEKMSLQNNGAARRIYEHSDADSQLKGFYEEVATPLLTDVTMVYVGGTNVTQTKFSQYYNGSEIVVAGQITDNESFTPYVEAISVKVPIKFGEMSKTMNTSDAAFDSRIERVWAYITVKQMLENELLLSGAAKDQLKEQILELSLKYKFVTPLTSMVVTKPPGENADVLHKGKETSSQQRAGLPLSGGSSPQVLPPLGVPGISRHHSGYPFHRLFAVPSRPIWDSVLSARDDEDMETRDMLEMDYGPTYSNPPTQAPHMAPTTTTPAPFTHRFLLKAENQSLPLCFDASGSVHLKLFHHLSADLFVDGQLDSLKLGGFTRIVVHLRTDHYIDIDVSGISVNEDHTVTLKPEPLFTAGRATVTTRDKEIDIAVGDSRLVILRHERDGKRFLWPVLKVMPSGDDIHGILVHKAPEYEEISALRLKIGQQEVNVSRASALDYSVASSPNVDCLLTSADSALQKSLGDFII
ncbi:inter-alpha-trypsin inhibitor heavy chain H3-like isoform X2 [Synchiropus splendidus]|uniref:inter-alpha-trypsin inhibitor heavy chain H3-like isoform X2 n=1 Tax=Synchiropus splendidus TaxID=270530 RepID=UPI00237E3730|nr:inter-alpha-trypsin inhibitor heavy chain H3-like isoform X2 [Synchiropus splendidus]